MSVLEREYVYLYKRAVRKGDQKLADLLKAHAKRVYKFDIA